MKLVFAILLVSLLILVGNCSARKLGGDLTLNPDESVITTELNSNPAGASSFISRLFGSINLKSFDQSREYAYMNNIL